MNISKLTDIKTVNYEVGSDVIPCELALHEDWIV